MSDIEANVVEDTITVSVSGGSISSTVSGGQGPQGPAATITVGTVTTGAAGTSAAVVNSGTSSAAVLDFTIPAGATGPQGPQGATGPAGTTTWAGITDKPSTFTPESHTHGSITNDGKVGTTSGRVLVTTTAGAVTSTDKLTQSQVASTLFGTVLSDDISYLHQNTASAFHTHTSGDVATVSNGSPLSEIDSFVDACMTSGYTTALVSVLGGVASSDSRLTNARTPTSHSHGNLANDGSIGSTANRIAVTTTGGVLTTATIGSGLTLSGGTLTASGGGGGSSVGSDLYLWSVYR